MLKLTRAKLHELIWSKPMTEIAAEYGVRDLHIAKACDLHEIARPRAGYWQKLAHSKPVKKAALGNDRFSADDVVIVHSAALTARQVSREPGPEATARRSTV